MTAGIAGAALAPRGRENEGVAVAVATAVPLAYATFDVRNKAMACVGQTPSGLLEHALILAARDGCRCPPPWLHQFLNHGLLPVSMTPC